VPDFQTTLTIRWADITTWFFRNQDDGEPDEWRLTDAR
jgi:hypothetical protein